MEIGEGNGWRLVIDPQRHPYAALIGGEQWAVELRIHELAALCRGVRTLQQQFRDVQPTLMAEEEIALELDLELPPDNGATPDAAGGGSLHVALQGDGRCWALRFILTPGDGARAVEGGWSAAASLPLAAALEQLDARPGASVRAWDGTA